MDFHPTEPWILASLYDGHVYVWNYETQVTWMRSTGQETVLWGYNCDPVAQQLGSICLKRHFVGIGENLRGH